MEMKKLLYTWKWLVYGVTSLYIYFFFKKIGFFFGTWKRGMMENVWSLSLRETKKNLEMSERKRKFLFKKINFFAIFFLFCGRRPWSGRSGTTCAFIHYYRWEQQQHRTTSTTRKKFFFAIHTTTHLVVCFIHIYIYISEYKKRIRYTLYNKQENGSTCSGHVRKIYKMFLFKKIKYKYKKEKVKSPPGERAVEPNPSCRRCHSVVVAS